MSGNIEESEVDVRELKIQLRAKSLESRTKLANAFKIDAANSLKSYFGDLCLETGQICAGYWPIRSEIDPWPLIDEIKRHGHRCALPVIEDTKIIFREYHNSDSLVEVGFGTLGPDSSAIEIEPDILLVPLAAFDRLGGRLGYGRGFYDGAIANLQQVKSICSIGLAYSIQEVEKVPMEMHDQFLDMIFTEQGVIKCK